MADCARPSVRQCFHDDHFHWEEDNMATRSLSRKDFVLLTFSAAGSALLGLACSSDDSTGTQTGSGGSAGTGGSSSGSGGSTDTGGSTGTGGSADTGGSTGTGGSAETGGSTGTGGSTDTGGSSGTGGTATADAGGNACSGDTITSTSSPADGKATGHTHTLTIPVADIMAGAPKTYTSSTASMHEHCIPVTAEDFATLLSGGVVKKDTCNGGNHEFVLSCAAGAPDPENPTTCPGGDNAGMC
jgi:hypothetical protein